MIIKMVISVVAYLILAPFVGGLLAGFDRKISARMQGRRSVLRYFSLSMMYSSCLKKKESQ